jgi:PKD repeat protein
MNCRLLSNIFISSVFLSILLCSNSATAQYQWPFPNPTTQAEVVGSVGEIRDLDVNDPRFHKGVDLTNGTNYVVHAINTGAVTWNEGIGMGSSITVTSANGVAIVYWHVDPTGGVGTTKTYVSIGDQLGTMGGSSSQHVHLESNDINFLDNNLTPYVDRAPPFFVTTHLPNGVAFYQNGLLRNTVNHTALLLDQQATINGVGNTKVYNKVDIVAHAGDSRTGSDGNALPTGRNLPTVISWRLKNSVNTLVAFNELNFEGVPNNAAAMSAFHPSSIAAGSPYISIHIVTSHPRTMPYDRFWNTGLRAGQTEDWNTTTTRSASLDARLNAEAAYPDGKYVMELNAHDVDFDSNPNLSAPQQNVNLLIDNFRPYVKQVTVSKYNAISTALAYDGKWAWNQTTNQLERIQQSLNPVGPVDRAYIKIIMSEPCTNVRVNVPAADGANYYSATAINDTEFFYVVNPIAASATQPINIQAEDLAGNALQTNPAQIPVRQANGTWSAGVSAGADSWHYFNTGTGTCAGAGGRSSSSSSGCLYVDITADKTNPALSEPVVFTPVVSGNGLITYTWNFGSGALPATSTSSGAQTVVYSTSGLKTVSLKICDNTGACLTETKTSFVNVGTPPTQLTVDFSADRYGANVGDHIQLTSIVTGAVGNVSYSWEFGDGLTLGHFSDVNPVIAYNTSGNKTIALTVTDANGSVSKVKNSYLVINSFLFDIQPTIFGCITTGADARASFSAAVSGGNGPPYDSYKWDFGDGTTSSSQSVSHTYKKSGKYTVRLTVCDETSCGTTESVGCVTVPSSVDARTLDPDFLIDDILLGPVYSSIPISLNTPVIVTDATIGGGDPTTFSYRWQLAGAKPSTEITTKGPHEIYYTATGKKDVDLTVVNSAVARREIKVEAINVLPGLGSGRCFANIGEATISSACWSPTNLPQIGVPVKKANCPVAKTEVIYWPHPGEGYVLPGNKLDFAAMGLPIPQFPLTAEFSVSVFQYDGANYNRIGYKRQSFKIDGPVLANAGTDQQICLGSSIAVGTTPQGNLSYKWTASDVNTLNFLSSTTSATPSFAGTQKGTYTLSLKTTDNSTGCSSTTDNVIVKVDKPEVLSASYNIPPNKNHTLSVSTSSGFGANTYTWEPATHLSSTTVAEPIFQTAVDGNYSYHVKVTDQKGCQGSSQVYLNVSNAAGSAQVNAVSFSRVVITWMDRSDNETGFLIQRSVGNASNFTDLATVAPNVTSYEDITVQQGTDYYYQVVTLFNGGQQAGEQLFVNTGSLPQFSIKGTDMYFDSYGDLDGDGKLEFVRPAGTSIIIYKINELYQLIVWKTIQRKGTEAVVGDFDNDNDLDIHISSNGNDLDYGKQSGLLLNNNGDFTWVDIDQVLSYDKKEFDVDNDNDIDLLVSSSTSNSKLYLYKNLGNTTFQSSQLPMGISISEYYYSAGKLLVAADFDNDGDQDVISPNGTALPVAIKLYRNNNGVFSDQTSLVPDFVYCGDIDAGDFDKNGKRDIVIVGDIGDWTQVKTRIFKNSGNFTFEEISIVGATKRASKFGDFNYDGNLDLLLWQNSGVWSGNGNSFERNFSSSEYLKDWIDVDGDGDLDIVTAYGKFLINNLGINNGIKINTSPTPPSNLCLYINGNQATFSWSPSNDAETPSAGLTYNLFVKRNGGFVMSPMADLATGFRKIVDGGNVDQNTSWTITVPSGSGPIEWGVQAIDNQYKGSKFSFGYYHGNQDLNLCGDISSPITHVWPSITAPALCQTNSVVVNNGSALSLVATNSIRLLPGFSVKAGGTFSAKISQGAGTIPCQPNSSNRVETESNDVAVEIQEEITESGEFAVYPNPTTGIITVIANFKNPASAMLSIVDVTGKDIFSKEYDDTLRLNEVIDLSKQAHGIYLVKLNYGNKKSMKRIVKL